MPKITHWVKDKVCHSRLSGIFPEEGLRTSRNDRIKEGVVRIAQIRYYLILAKDPGYIDTKKLESQLEEISKLLEAYSKAILDSGY